MPRQKVNGVKRNKNVGHGKYIHSIKVKTLV